MRLPWEATIQRYVWLYNHHIPQKFLGHMGSSNNLLLCGRMAALRGARMFAYLADMSRILRPGGLALQPLLMVLRAAHVTPIEAMKRWYVENKQSEFRRSQKIGTFHKNTTESFGI